MQFPDHNTCTADYSCVCFHWLDFACFLFVSACFISLEGDERLHLMHGIRRMGHFMTLVTWCLHAFVFSIQFGRPTIMLGHANPNPMMHVQACWNLPSDL